MAFQSRRFIGFLERFNRTRYHSHYISSPTSFFPFPFSTLDDRPSSNHIKNEINPKERFVLDQLSELLPIHRNSSTPNPFRYSEYPTKQVAEFRAVDSFLLPEEKLRGVFLQKLKGKTAIEQALTNVGF